MLIEKKDDFERNLEILIELYFLRRASMLNRFATSDIYDWISVTNEDYLSIIHEIVGFNERSKKLSILIDFFSYLDPFLQLKESPWPRPIMTIKMRTPRS